MTRSLSYEEACVLERYPRITLRRSGRADVTVKSDSVPTNGIIRIQYPRGRAPIVEISE